MNNTQNGNTIYFTPDSNLNIQVSAEEILSLLTEEGFVTPYPIDPVRLKSRISEIIRKNSSGNFNVNVSMT